MNAIEQGQSHIENGWCRGDLLRADGKFCSVGAVVTALIGNTQLLKDPADAYKVFNASAEAKAMSEAVFQTEWFKDMERRHRPFAEHLRERHANGNHDEVVYSFNDDAKDQEAVVEMFRMSNKIFTEVLQPA